MLIPQLEPQLCTAFASHINDFRIDGRAEHLDTVALWVKWVDVGFTWGRTRSVRALALRQYEFDQSVGMISSGCGTLRNWLSAPPWEFDRRVKYLLKDTLWSFDPFDVFPFRPLQHARTPPRGARLSLS